MQREDAFQDDFSLATFTTFFPLPVSNSQIDAARGPPRALVGAANDFARSLATRWPL
jgi:hypothetical protein